MKYLYSKDNRSGVSNSVVILFLLIALTGSILSGIPARAESKGTVINASGTENRKISVDATGRSEGFSAVLYDNSNGLPTSEANAIAETSDGFIWIGSYAGLIRYDGNTFERIDSTDGIASIKCLFVDSLDRLWIGTNDNGVALMEKGSLRLWGRLDGMKSAHTRAITEDENGTIYIATTQGIMMMDRDLNLTEMNDPDVNDADMRDLRLGADGVIYGTTNLGDLMMIKDGKVLKYIKATDNPLLGVGAILPDPEGKGRLYMEAVDFGLYHVDISEEFKVLKKIEIEPLKYLRQIEYIDGKAWICADNGIGVLEDDESFHVIDNLPMNSSVGRVMTDYLGNLWFTSTRQGVMKIVPNRFSNLFSRYDIPDTVVNSTCISDGKIFCATDTGLIVLDEKGKVAKIPVESAVTASGKQVEADDLIKLLEGSRIRSIIKDSKGRIWISLWRSLGLLCYDPESEGLIEFTEEDGLLSPDIRAVSETKDGRIIVGLTGGANIIQDDKITTSYSEESGIMNEETLSVSEGLNGELLIGSNGGGIYVITESGTKTINVEEGLPSDIVMRIKKDEKRNIVWLVTSSAIAYMTPDYKVNTIKKFPYTNNFDMYEDAGGDMWVLSSNGIYVVPIDELIKNEDINPVYYGMDRGLPCIATANSYSDVDVDGELYIAGSTGVGKVNINETFDDVNNIAATIPYMEADGERIYPDETGTFIVPKNIQKLTIPYYVFNYSLINPQISYRLEGFEEQTTTISRSDVVPLDYTNLSGGDYRFILQIKDAMGSGSKEIIVPIFKEKKLYEQWWFIVIMGLIAAALVVLLAWLLGRGRLKATEKKREEARKTFEQTAEALAGAIDAKDTYTNGHSRRVAEYSLEIAKLAHKSDEECEKVYFSALLHDVGKIGVPIEILTKKGRLTDEEFEQIKQHPIVGGQILSSIKNSPWLSYGARYHHERYNGRGYPEGLSGEDIPEIARIIAVADAYDAMTSNRSYRDAIPQHIVREEIVKGIGTQFDPRFATIMLHMIDLDTEYKMQESEGGNADYFSAGIRCDSMYHECSEGILVTDRTSHISLCSMPDGDAGDDESLPALIVFDSLDGKVHPGEEDNKNLLYHEYARVRLDGQVTEGGIRKSEVTISEQLTDLQKPVFGEPEDEQRYRIDALHIKDHVMINITSETRVINVIMALPDSSHFVYISIGGEKCTIHNIRIENDETVAEGNAIRRIAEEISYIKDAPQGDIPNIQIDGWRTESTRGIRVEKEMTLRFHAMSLPSARLVWHCPFISLFSSNDGMVNGSDHKEHLLLRFDGETWQSDEHVENEIRVSQSPDFAGWGSWMETNKKGIDCVVTIKRDGNIITMHTENQGLAIDSATTIKDGTNDVYIALTGDQCCITDIHFM
ncbi:MAG: HD domain-containing protein [Eubacterium sp.]|nr:HD domain-containing protein [Eubacterium sp.]